MARKKTTPAPVVLTPEQLAAQAARDARNDAYVAARLALITKARELAEKLSPGRVFTYTSTNDMFIVMFGEAQKDLSTFRGPGMLEFQVELSHWTRVEGSDEFESPTLRFGTRGFTSSGGDLQHCEALGHALLDAAALGRTLLALTSTAA